MWVHKFDRPNLGELTRVALHVLELSKVASEERVVIYADTRQQVRLVEAFYTASAGLGCDVTLVTTLHRFPETDPPHSAVVAMEAADFVVDMATESWVYAPAARRILESGTRSLLILDLDEERILARPPDREAGGRASAAAELLKDAENFHVTSEEGTDFHCRRGGRPYSIQKGYADVPGRFALYGAAMINFAPLEGSGEGIIYLNGPQILYPDHTYVVDRPVRLEIEAGRIRRVDSSHRDGQIFLAWLEQFDENIRVVSHMGFGTDHRADFSNYAINEWESYYGGVIIAFGANDSLGLQGENRSDGHSDSILLNASLSVDGVSVIERGEFTEASGLRQTDQP